MALPASHGQQSPWCYAAGMKSLMVTNVLLLMIAGLLIGNHLRPSSAHAQSDAIFPVYIEPGTRMLRSPDGSTQVLGKVVVDLRSGRIWGFPTLSDSPYPIDTTKPQAATSDPIYLGRFNFAAMKQ